MGIVSSGDVASVVRLAAVLVSSGCLIVALEDLRNREEYSDSGLMARGFADSDFEPGRRALSFIAQGAFDCAIFYILIGARVIGSLVLIISACLGVMSIGILAGVLLAMVVISDLRSPYGGDGGDQMIVIVLVGIIVTDLFPVGTSTQLAGAWFVTVQLVASYSIAGVAKLASPAWRDGTGLAGVLGTYSYGSDVLADVTARNRRLTATASWFVILFETTFWLCLFLPAPFVACYLLAGLLFHSATAAVMSLNTFWFAFLAAYPFAWYCFVR